MAGETNITVEVDGAEVFTWYDYSSFDRPDYPGVTIHETDCGYEVEIDVKKLTPGLERVRVTISGDG